ncbi:Ldh family oxidoreductase [Curvivirga sp.]|uniref:Ldh family oxidoreductase n=1 Tax=Curvivirga sp. TaxID=2856848 RepID=UPI003B5BDD25
MAKLTATEIETLAFDALLGAGTNETSARSMARAAAAAEIDGIRSHGLVYIPIYCEHVKCGKVIGDAKPEVKQTAASSIHVNANSGFAHPAIDAGFEKLIPTAKENGIAALGIYNSYNCGVLAYHAETLAKEGLVALCFTNAPASIAPVGGKKPVIGTNPYSLAIPGEDGDAAFVIDQSASVIAKSEINLHAREDKPIPEGWAFDAEGNPTTDPHAALKGSMAPSGGYKGFGNGLMVEVFAAALSGAFLGKDASPFAGTAGGPPKTGQFFIAISPQHFSGELFAERVKDLCTAITDQDGARLPGSRRKNNRIENQDDGVEVSDDLIEKIKSFNT